ncbi:uncharacterized protein LOC120006995 [Tripterygium wilfordii]|uniref:uncharacterized protein LOC120006995 n=1 Tax=Tripterygium wilfordii TaxID=458696 RepID=UPI0018F7EB22|nr:uncharacterized protein LOC120006995 [Tripterygium wilfordii]
MKNSHKNFSRKRIPATSEGVDENGKSYREMGRNLRSPSKPVTKNFMSPTISATSKANPPRKEVLAERNQITDSPLQKSFNIDSKSTQKTPLYDSRAASVISSPGTTGFGNNDSDLSPYDPLTNYLSPRPEFLRYKPNRLREILLRMEKADEESSDESSLGGSVSTETKKVNDDETDSLHASQEDSLRKENEELEFSDEEFEEEKEEVKGGMTVNDDETDSLHASQEASLKKENEELEFSDVEFKEEEEEVKGGKMVNDDETDTLHASQVDSLKRENEELEFSDEEFEEEEEEVKGGKTGFLKFFLLLVVLVFATSYIYSMNSPTPSPATQAIQDWQYRMHDLVYGMVASYEGKSGVFYSQNDLIGLNHTIIGHDTLAEELVEDIIRGLGDSDEWSQVEEVQTGKFEVMEVVKDELVEEQAGVVCEDACDLKMDTVEISNVKNENIEIKGGQIEENIGVVEVYDHQFEGSDSSVHQQIDVKDENIVVLAELVEEQAGVENIEVVLAELVEGDVRVREDASDLKMNTGEISYKKIENVELESGLVEENFGLVEVYGYQVEVPDFSNVTGRKEDGFLMDPLKEVEHEELNQEAIEVQNIEILSHEVEGSLEEEEEEAVEYMVTESISRGVICVALFSVVSASLTLSFCFKKARKVRQSSPSVFVPSVGPVIEEKCCLDSVDSYENRLHSVDFRKIVSENSYQTRAPSIELLSEFEVGSISSSLRSGGMKSRMFDSEVSSHYFSQEKELGSTSDSVPIPVQPELSSMSSPSFGSYTAEKKIIKKQKLEGGDYEHKIVMTTPVRRSTRIRNRAVTSP